MKTLDQIKKLKKSVETEILSRSGVTGVGIAYKVVNGKKTDELSICVYVEKKKDVSAEKQIPKKIQGVKTDVIECRFIPHSLTIPVESWQLQADTGTYDALQGGISIGPCRYLEVTDQADADCRGLPIGNYLTVGTLGAFVRANDTGEIMMLSNFHVMALDNSWTTGDEIVQPGRVDGGSCPSGVVGELRRASIGGQVDCAAALLTNRDHSCQIIEIGPINGQAVASIDQAVRKRGRTTGLSHGTVRDTSATINVPFCNGIGVVRFTDQILIDVDQTQSTQFGNSGDSGSVVVNDQVEVVGLYFAGSTDGAIGVANPIQAVLNALNVSLCVDRPTLFETLPIARDKMPWHDDFRTEVDRDTIFTRAWEDFGFTWPLSEGPPSTPWSDLLGGTPNKAFDDVKHPAGYDTQMESIQEGYQNPWEQYRHRPREVAPFVLSTPHHASEAAMVGQLPQTQRPREINNNSLEDEIQRVRQYLSMLEARRG